MVTVETVSVVFTGLSVSLAAFYYISTLRNAQRAQQMTLETRQAQIYTQFALHFNSTEALRTYMDVLNWEWEDYHDFEMKYGSDNNPQAWAMRTTLWAAYNYLGKLLRENIISLDLVYSLIAETAIWQWAKWKDIIEEQRRRYYTSDFMADWEYLYSELMRHKEELGFSWEPPATLGKYISDEM